MTAISSDTAATTDREIIITRLLSAKRERVFEAWTDPAQLPQWWGPNGFTTTTREIDIRPGGAWRFVMHGRDGVDYPNAIRYVEIEAPERLVYVHGDDSEKIGGEFCVTVTFDAEGDGTRLTMHSLFGSAAERDRVVAEYGAIEGGNQTLARLQAHLLAT